MVHLHSIAAYHELDKEGRRFEVKGAFERRGPMTDRQAALFLGSQDPNYVRPRITELIRSGDLIECGKIRDEYTGRTVRVVRVAIKTERQMEFGEAKSA